MFDDVLSFFAVGLLVDVYFCRCRILRCHSLRLNERDNPFIWSFGTYLIHIFFSFGFIRRSNNGFLFILALCEPEEATD